MRVRKFKPFTELRVFWKDIVQDATWQSSTDKCGSVMVKTVGMFVKNKKRDLILCHSITNDGEYDTLVIPFGCIEKIEEIKDGGTGQS